MYHRLQTQSLSESLLMHIKLDLLYASTGLVEATEGQKPKRLRDSLPPVSRLKPVGSVVFVHP